jgi:putative DNA primase/helicase
VPDEIRDLQLFEKLQLEGNGILAWAIAGLKRLMQNNWVFGETDRTRAETQKYKIENNNVLAFAADRCVVEPDATCHRQELFEEYQLYCNDSGGKPVGISRFNKDIAGLPGVALGDDSRTRRALFRGIRLV